MVELELAKVEVDDVFVKLLLEDTAERHCERGVLLCHTWDTPSHLQFGPSGSSL